MTPHIQLTREPIRLEEFLALPSAKDGAQAFFSGHVREQEKHQKISFLVYEAYEDMALKELDRLAHEIHSGCPISEIRVLHRLGTIPVRETAVAIRVTAPHRKEALAFLETFMSRLKEDVPIWKTGSLP